MALPSPPSSISLSQVNIELGNPGTTEISMNDAAVRSLFAKPTGAIAMSDGYGKSAVPAITGVTVTIPHPQPANPGATPAPLEPQVAFNAGPVLAPPGPGINPSPSNFNRGFSCSPNPIVRQIVCTKSFGGNWLTPSTPGTPNPERVEKVTRKNVTVSYAGGPTGPGPGQTNVNNLTWSISTDCPDYSPTALNLSYPVPGGTPIPVPVAVIGNPSPTQVLVSWGLGRDTLGPPGAGNIPAGPDIPYPSQPPGGPTSFTSNIHTRYVITGTAPAPLGGASGSTSCGVVCLPLDTEVTMEDDSIKPMKDIKVGDRVKTFDPDTNEISSNEVTHLLKRHVASELIHIKLENDIEFRATPEHECWIRREDEGMWIMAELIEEGDSMLTEGIEYQKVVKVEKVEYEEGIEVGNISVAGAHVYFANKVLMHNFTGL